MCDLKAGHILKASSKDLLKAQLTGSLFGAFIASSSYALLTRYYHLKLGTTGPFDMPSAHMWLEAAKLSVGKGLPERAIDVSIGTAIVFVVGAGVKIRFANVWWVCAFVPKGASFALGE